MDASSNLVRRCIQLPLIIFNSAAVYKHGFYGIGEKVGHQAALILEQELRNGPVHIKEIEKMLVSVFDTKLSDLENVSAANMDNLIAAYPGNLDCGEALDCQNRQNVANNLFHGALDVYSGLDAALQAVCVTAEVNIPYSVLIANLMAGRALDDSKGFSAAGYVPSGV